jgi:hypothetical protein
MVYATYLPWIIPLVIPSIIIFTLLFDQNNEHIAVNAHLFFSFPLLTLCIIISTFLQFNSLYAMYQKRRNRVQHLDTRVRNEVKTQNPQNANNYSGVWHTHASKLAQQTQQTQIRKVCANVEAKMFINALIMVVIMIMKNFVYVVVVFKINAIPYTEINFYVNDIFSLINPILLVSSSRDVRRMLYCAIKGRKYSPF